MTTSQLLAHYLPPKNGRQPAERLKAIAGRATADARKQHHLDRLQAEDAFGEALKAGIRALTEYDPGRDNGAGNVPIDIRFGRFAYLRMRLRITDWKRKHIHDSRPGRTDRRQELLEPDDQRLQTAQPWQRQDFDEFVQLHAWKLSPLHQWTLEHLMRLVDYGHPLVTAADELGIPLKLATLLRDDLAGELEHALNLNEEAAA